MNEITNNHQNELTERKDPIIDPVSLVGSLAIGATVVAAARVIARNKRKRRRRTSRGKK